MGAVAGRALNVLLTSAGRHSYLVESFREALRGRGRVFAAHAKASAPALQEADDIFLLPPVGHKHYLDALLEFCQEERVSLLVPLSDLELPLLAAAKARFETLGTTLLVSSPEVVGVCFDKWATHLFLEHLFVKHSGLSAPKTHLSLEGAKRALAAGELSFPLVIKPRWGSASVGLEFPQDEAELELAYTLLHRRLARTSLAAKGENRDQDVLIQEFLVGDEFGLDVVNDLSGGYVTTFVQQKLGIHAGETDSAETVANSVLESLGETLGRRLGHIGNLEADVFVNDAGVWALELNPRFGSGYPFAHVAGANLPAALLAWASGEPPEQSWLRPKVGVVASKYSRLLLIAQK